MQLIKLFASRYRSNLELLGRHGSLVQSYAVARGPFGGGRLHHSRLYSSNQRLNVHPQRQNAPKNKMLRWAIGTVLAVALSFWSDQWKNILRIGGEIEMAEEVVENAAGVIEKVAEVTEKVSSEFADKLSKNGMLKDAVLLVEHVSKEAAEEAHLTQDILHKVDELKEDVENLLEPIIKPEKGHGK